MNNVETILFAEDERVLRESVAKFLGDAGYRVLIARDGAEAIDIHSLEHPDLVLLDVGMPKVDGRAACAAIRRTDSAVPILLYTAFDGDDCQIEGLSVGADDFISKDVPNDILLARLSAALRRSRRVGTGNFVFGEGWVDVAAQCFTEGNQSSDLTVREVELLRYFSQNEGVVLSKDALLAKLFGVTGTETVRTVDKLIERLRLKLFSSARCLVTIPRQGIRYGKSGQTSFANVSTAGDRPHLR